MALHPTVHWGHLVAWAQANGVPDTSLVTDDESRQVTGVSARQDSRLYLAVCYGGDPPALTWAQLRQEAEESGVQAADLLRVVEYAGRNLIDDRRIVDFSSGKADGEHYLCLQRRWG